MGLLGRVTGFRRRKSAARLKQRFEHGEVLLPCIGVWGETEVEENDPGLEVHRNATYVPRNTGFPLHEDHGWGLYQADGPLIEASAYRRGPGPIRVGMADRTNWRPGDIESAPDCLYVYLGMLHRHYGHFLISGLARFWPRLKARGDAVRLLYHGDDEPAAMFEQPFVAAILAALEIGPGDLVRFSEPVTLREVIVPRPSFEESLLAHRVHARMGAEIGRRLLGDAPVIREERPVFLSRAKLTGGIRRFVEEDQIAEALERAGHRIVSPETLCLADQVRLFETHPLIVAVVGSSLHTALLAPTPSNILAIQHQAVVPSDYRMVDILKGNQATYLWAQGESTSVDLAANGFQVEFRLRNVSGTIDALLHHIDRRAAELRARTD